MEDFMEIDNKILKFIRKCKGLRITKTILKKNNKVGEVILSDLKTYYKTMKQSGTGEIINK